MTTFRSGTSEFRPRARLLILLGDQLIRDPGIAVFELVKNAYDADSPVARVTMSHIENRDLGEIVVEDSGTGMDYETVTNVWLEPGTDYRIQQRQEEARTEKYGRLPLGEKGVGRFAAHKLGRHVTLISRKKGMPEVVVEIDWDKFAQSKYLADIPILVLEREPVVFTGRKSGTRIEIRRLHQPWTKGMVRDLARSINSICSPFEKEGDFTVELVLTEKSEWLEGLLTVDRVLEYALFRAHCKISPIPHKSPVQFQLTYEYEFKPLSGMDKIRPRKINIRGKKAINLGLGQHQFELLSEHVGPIEIDLYIFDREPRILSLGVADKKGLKEFLDTVGGIRVYRDGIRVYDYGELGNDWLDLGGRRVNRPAERISNNIVVGAATLALDKSMWSNMDSNIGLIEKTNREGFVDNAVYRAFRDSVIFAVNQIEAERLIDKTRIRNQYRSTKTREAVTDDLAELRQLIQKRKLSAVLGSYLDRIEADFVLIRDRFLTSANAGLSLSVVIHEVEKGITELATAVQHENASPRVQNLAKHLADLIEGFGTLVRRSGTSKEKASDLVTQALFNTEFRLKLHHIKAVVDCDQGDFQTKCSRRLIISTLMNLIDNSIWWLDNKWGESADKKRIYIGTSADFAGGPTIVVADNGPGFLDPPEFLIEPFISRKPDGMGLGLHIADQVMKAQGGKLEFPQPGDLTIPKEFDGAIVALVFGGGKK